MVQGVASNLTADGSKDSTANGGSCEEVGMDQGYCK